jgi:hypothetical protein
MITDDFSRYRKTVPLKYKDEAKKAIQEFIAEIEAKCYGTNSGASSDGRHLAPGRPAGPRDETLPSIVLMVLMV